MCMLYRVTYGPRLGARFVHPAHEENLGTYQGLLQAKDAAEVEFGILTWILAPNAAWTANLPNGNGVEITGISRANPVEDTIVTGP
ncbi:hypothetical protein ACFY5D_21775 [Paeniglutamicibacter sp. NPDC012692]|uniref:hypothetical protein n=1 Tax=Paeniglutamicibacter sp. NPDC012692 TaxID=3364388 RepID=UPI00369F877F